MRPGSESKSAAYNASMTSSWTPPTRSFYLRVFASALALVVCALVGVLFGLRMDALTHADGVLQARDQHQLRAPCDGVLELGWHEGTLEPTGDKVRLDRLGNGLSRLPSTGALLVSEWKTADGLSVPRALLRLQVLRVGDVLWPGQPAACVTVDGKPVSCLRAPDELKGWLVAKVFASSGQAVKAGDPLALLLPCDPQTGEPEHVEALLHIEEKHAAHVAAGQEVRLFSTMYPQRLFGHAQGILEKIEPQAEIGEHGRFFQAHVRVTQSPFPLKLGSSVKAEIVVGRKQIYRVILEH